MKVWNLSFTTLRRNLFPSFLGLLFSFLIVFSSIAQEISIEKLPQLNLNKRMNESDTANTIGWNDFIEDPPIQLGLDAGTSFLRKSEIIYLSTCFIGSMDINLYNKVIFLRLEAGRLFYTSYNGQFTRISLGPNFKIFKPGKSRFFLSTVASFDFGKRGIRGLLEASMRYVYLLSKVFGISTSIRYPFWNTDSSGRGEPIIGIGIQLFTK